MWDAARRAVLQHPFALFSIYTEHHLKAANAAFQAPVQTPARRSEYRCKAISLAEGEFHSREA